MLVPREEDRESCIKLELVMTRVTVKDQFCRSQFVEPKKMEWFQRVQKGPYSNYVQLASTDKVIKVYDRHYRQVKKPKLIICKKKTLLI